MSHYQLRKTSTQQPHSHNGHPASDVFPQQQQPATGLATHHPPHTETTIQPRNGGGRHPQTQHSSTTTPMLQQQMLETQQITSQQIHSLPPRQEHQLPPQQPQQLSQQIPSQQLSHQSQRTQQQPQQVSPAQHLSQPSQQQQLPSQLPPHQPPVSHMWPLPGIEGRGQGWMAGVNEGYRQRYSQIGGVVMTMPHETMLDMNLSSLSNETPPCVLEHESPSNSDSLHLLSSHHLSHTNTPPQSSNSQTTHTSQPPHHPATIHETQPQHGVHHSSYSHVHHPSDLSHEEQESQQEGEGVVGIPQMDNDEFLQIGIESRSSSPMSKIREEPSLLAQSVCCTSCGVPPEEKRGIVFRNAFHTFVCCLPNRQYEDSRIFIHESLGYSGNTKSLQEKKEEGLILDCEVYQAEMRTHQVVPVEQCTPCQKYFEQRKYFKANPECSGRLILVKSSESVRVCNGAFAIKLRFMCCASHHGNSDFICLFHLSDPVKKQVIFVTQSNLYVKQWKKSTQMCQTFVLNFTEYQPFPLSPSIHSSLPTHNLPPPSENVEIEKTSHLQLLSSSTQQNQQIKEPIFNQQNEIVQLSERTNQYHHLEELSSHHTYQIQNQQPHNLMPNSNGTSTLP